MTCSSAPNLVCPQTKNGCGTLKLKSSRINQVSHYKASCKCVSVETGLDEMIAMVSERWLATHIPLLVLSSVPDIESQRLPCSDIVEKLNLASLNRPWQVSQKTATKAFSSNFGKRPLAKIGKNDQLNSKTERN